MMKRFAICVVAMLCSLTTASAQSQPKADGERERLIGAWHLVRIDAGGSETQSASAPQPLGILVYTRDGHMSVQLMYPEAAHGRDNGYVRAGYEASFGSYDVDEAKHRLTHHVQGSITRDLLVGRDLQREYQLTADGHLIIRSADPNEHWSVTWQHY
jgi:hypothetical protein